MKKFMPKTIIAALVTVAMCAVALAGCAGNVGGGTLGSEIIDETGAFKVVADNADADSAVAVEDVVTLKEGEVLLVSPDLTKGKLQVTLTDKSGNEPFNEEVSGRVLDTHEVALGTYSIRVACVEAGTTGSLVVAAVNAEEFEQQNSDLEAILGSTAAK